eukprot:1164257-Amorphochlora_amoeboformis.AAC.3
MTYRKPGLADLANETDFLALETENDAELMREVPFRDEPLRAKPKAESEGESMSIPGPNPAPLLKAPLSGSEACRKKLFPLWAQVWAYPGVFATAIDLASVGVPSFGP